MGVLPVAIKRFSDGDTRYRSGYPRQPLAGPRLPPAGSQRRDFHLAVPLDDPPPTAAGYSDPEHYDPAISGRVFAFLGENAHPNVAQSANFHFWVGADIRDITNPAGATFLGGLDSSSSLQTMKDIEASYFAQKGYSGPFVDVGDQVAAMLGVDWAWTVTQVRKVFKRGDVVTAMVYDGTVYRAPSYSLDVTPVPQTRANINQNLDGSYFAPYRITLTPENGFASPIDGVRVFRLRAEEVGRVQLGLLVYGSATVAPATSPSGYPSPPYDSSAAVQPTGMRAGPSWSTGEGRPPSPSTFCRTPAPRRKGRGRFRSEPRTWVATWCRCPAPRLWRADSQDADLLPQRPSGIQDSQTGRRRRQLRGADHGIQRLRR